MALGRAWLYGGQFFILVAGFEDAPLVHGVFLHCPHLRFDATSSCATISRITEPAILPGYELHHCGYFFDDNRRAASTMSISSALLCILCVILSSSGQLLFKGSLQRSNFWITRGLLGLGCGLMFAGILIATYVLRTVPLSLIMPFSACAYIIIPLGALVFFHEKVNPRFWLGVAFIMLGIIVSFL